MQTLELLVMQPAAHNLAQWERRYLVRLAPGLRARYAALGHPQRRLEWLCSRVMLLEGFSRLHSMDSPSLAVGSGGQPEAANGWHSAISHSHGLVVAAIGRTPVGVDLEWRRRDRPLQALDRHLTAAERRCFEYAPDTPRGNAERIRAWMLKEAAAKTVGKTVWDGLKGAVLVCGDAEHGPGLHIQLPLPSGRWSFWEAAVRTDWQCAVASLDGGGVTSPRLWAVSATGELNLEEQPVWAQIPVYASDSAAAPTRV